MLRQVISNDYQSLGNYAKLINRIQVLRWVLISRKKLIGITDQT